MRIKKFLHQKNIPSHLLGKDYIMKYFYTTIFILLINTPIWSQTYGNDSLLFLNKKFQAGDVIVLDTFKTNVNNWRSSIEYPFGEKLYALTSLLKKRQELNIEIIVLMNSNYDTTSANWMRVNSRKIIEDLIYFNINPLQFQVKDSLDIELDKKFSPEEAFRKIILRVKEPTEYEKSLTRLEQIFDSEEKNYKRFFTNQSSTTNNKNTHLTNAIELDSFGIPQLIDSFHNDIFKKNIKTSFAVVPERYPVELGEFRKVINEEIDFEDYYIPKSINIDSWVESSFLISHRVNSKSTNLLLFNEQLRRSFEKFLAYEFKYDLDTFSNWPSNIVPSNETKEKLNDLKSFINPRIEVAFKGQCNAHTFWEFHWELQSPFTGNKISINRKNKRAFVFYKNEDLENFAAIYQLRDNTTWKYLDKINLGTSMTNEEPKTRILKFVLLFCALFSFGIIFFLKRKKNSV